MAITITAARRAIPGGTVEVVSPAATATAAAVAPVVTSSGAGFGSSFGTSFGG